MPLLQWVLLALLVGMTAGIVAANTLHYLKNDEYVRALEEYREASEDYRRGVPMSRVHLEAARRNLSLIRAKRLT